MPVLHIKAELADVASHQHHLQLKQRHNKQEQRQLGQEQQHHLEQEHQHQQMQEHQQHKQQHLAAESEAAWWLLLGLHDATVPVFGTSAVVAVPTAEPGLSATGLLGLMQLHQLQREQQHNQLEQEQQQHQLQHEQQHYLEQEPQHHQMQEHQQHKQQHLPAESEAAWWLLLGLHDATVPALSPACWCLGTSTVLLQLKVNLTRRTSADVCCRAIYRRKDAEQE